MIEHRMVQETRAPNSFEFGKAGQRHKVYYENLEEMKLKIEQALVGEKYLAEMQQVITEGDFVGETPKKKQQTSPSPLCSNQDCMKPISDKQAGHTNEIYGRQLCIKCMAKQKPKGVE